MDIYGTLIFLLPLLLVAVLGFYYGRKILRWSNNNHSEIITYEITITEKKKIALRKEDIVFIDKLKKKIISYIFLHSSFASTLEL